MTNEKATALREAAERARRYWTGEDDFRREADPETVLALLAERERLRGALEAARGWVVTCSESATARRDLKLIDQALEASHEPS